MKKTLTILAILAVLAIIVMLQFSPWEEARISSPQPTQSISPKQVIGFLPYWQLGESNDFDFSILAGVFFFGVHFDEKGKLDANDVNRLDSTSFKMLAKNVDTSLVLILQDNEKIELFLEDKKAWNTLLEELSPLIAEHNLEGINIDVEYSGIPARDTVGAFTDFVSHMAEKLGETDPNLVISVDMTADSVRKSRLYDVEHVAAQIDYVVLMGYDFYKPGSSVAGPVAPLTGREIYDYDVSSSVADFLAFVPKEKLLLGVPYYGWDFPTKSGERGSFVENEPVALATYRRTRRLIEESDVDLRFDQESQTPWIIYKDPQTGGTRQIWFENEVSLSKKYDLVNKENIAGVAIWALGYDGSYRTLWDLLEEKFGSNLPVKKRSQ